MVGRFEDEDVIAGCISGPLIRFRIRTGRHRSVHRAGESPLPYACIFLLVKEIFRPAPEFGKTSAGSR